MLCNFLCSPQAYSAFQSTRLTLNKARFALMARVCEYYASSKFVYSETKWWKNRFTSIRIAESKLWCLIQYSPRLTANTDTDLAISVTGFFHEIGLFATMLTNCSFTFTTDTGSVTDQLLLAAVSQIESYRIVFFFDESPITRRLAVV